MAKRPGDIFLTSDTSRIAIVPCSPIVKQHAIVLFSECDRVIRQRALDEIKRLWREGDESAGAVLDQFSEWKNEKNGEKK